MPYDMKMTLIANGIASGPARVTVTPHATTFATFVPSGNGFFKSSAHTWSVHVFNAQVVSDFVCGYMTIVDSNNWPAMNRVPFCAYIGPEWPQAPIGIVHNPTPICISPDDYWIFSVIIEKAA